MAVGERVLGPLFWPRIVPLLIIFVLGATIYANTFTSPFVLDDTDYVVQNPAVRDFRYYSDLFLTEKTIDQQRLGQNFRTRVVGYFTFALNYRFHGLTVQGYHAVNLLIHLATGFLVYWLIQATLLTPLFQGETVNERSSQIANSLPLLMALLFIAHPVQTEAVTYISQRFTSLATLFYLLSLLLYIRWRLLQEEESPASMARTLLYWLAVITAVLAMFTKEIAFTLPLVIIGYEVMFFGMPRRKRSLAILPFALTMLIIPAIIFSKGARYEDVTRLLSSFTGTEADNPVRIYLYTQFPVIVTYLRLLVLPVKQNLDYDYPHFVHFFQGPVAVSFLFLCLIAGAGISLYRRAEKLPRSLACWYMLTAFGIFWFFTTLSVESTVMPLGDVIFEHRLYLPSVGFFLSLLGLVGILRQRLRRKENNLIALVLIVVLGVMSMAAYARNSVWRDTITLGEDTISKSPNKYRPHHNLAENYLEKGDYGKALEHYQAALKVAADYGELLLSYVSLENLYQQQHQDELVGKIREAQQELFSRELQKRTDAPLFNDLGIFQAKMERWHEAEKALLRAISLRGNIAVYHLNLAQVYLAQGKNAEGLAALREATRIDPYDEIIQESLGDELATQGQYDEALAAYREALALNPASTSLYTKVAGEHIRAGRLDDADSVLRQGVAAREDDPWAYNDLAMFLERTDRPGEAETMYLQALALNDRLAEIHTNLGLLYLGQARPEKALASLNQAAAIDPANPEILQALSQAHAIPSEYRNQQPLLGRSKLLRRPFLKKGGGTNSTGWKKPRERLG